MSVTLLANNSATQTKYFIHILILSARQIRHGPQHQYLINVNVNRKKKIKSHQSHSSFLGKNCLDPPIPDDKYHMILDPSYDSESPREIDEAIYYYCNTEAIEGTTHWNRRLDNFGNSYAIYCREKNTWDTPAWPTCAPSMIN